MVEIHSITLTVLILIIVILFIADIVLIFECLDLWKEIEKRSKHE